MIAAVSYLRAPKPPRRQWLVSFRSPRLNKVVTIAAYRRRDHTDRFKTRLDALIDAAEFGNPPPRELQPWIDNLSEKRAKRLIEVGLLPAARFEQGKPLVEHFDAFEAAIGSRRTASYAKNRTDYLRKSARSKGWQVYGQVDDEGLMGWLAEGKYASATRKHYVGAWRQFCRWMVETNRAQHDPMRRARAGVVTNQQQRRPLSVDEFRRLMAYLESGKAPDAAYGRWTAEERRVVYWTAVSTGLRKGELGALRKGNLHLGAKPPYLSLAGKHTKNREDAGIPLPADVAAELRRWTSKMTPDAKVFRMPTSQAMATRWLRNDLKAAGVEWDRHTGETQDFHTLRSTAITWWLEEYGLGLKRVQSLARLKTLALVQRYVRGARFEEFGYLDKAPNVMGPVDSQTKAG